MSRHCPKSPVALIAMLPALVAAQAQDVALPPRYNVEIVVFAHTDVDPGEEIFDVDETPAAVPGDLPRHRPQDLLAIERIGPDLPTPIVRDFVLPAEPAAGSAQAGGPPTDSTDSAPGGSANRPAAGADPATATRGADATDPLGYIGPFGRMTALEPVTEGAAAPAFRLLRADELMLDDARNVIDRLGAYRLLGHAGWQQFGLGEAEAMPVDLARLGIANPTGTVQLYLGRFLHMRLDLDYRDTPGLATPLPAGSDPSAGNPALPGRSPPLTTFALPRHYRLDTERNAIRSGELHYVDHPRFGVIVLVTPAPEEEAEVPLTGGEEQPSA